MNDPGSAKKEAARTPDPGNSGESPQMGANLFREGSVGTLPCGHELRVVRGLPEANDDCMTCAWACLGLLQLIGEEMEHPHRFVLTGITEAP